MDIELTLLNLAEGNDGIVARRHALAAGCSARSIGRRIALGFLEVVFPSVYRVSGYPGTYRSRVRAAWLWGGEGALLCGGTILSLWGLEGFKEALIELYLPSGKSAPGVRVRRLPGSLPTRPLGGMIGTSLERAFLDACARYPAARVGRAIDDALRRRLTTVARLRAAVPGDLRGVKGAKAFAKLVRGRDLNDQKVRSEMETRMLRILRRIKSHAITPNFEVRGREGRYFLDFAFPQVRLGIECHSRRFHGPERVPGDLARDRDLKRMGWMVLYYSWDDLVFRPDEVQAEIEEFLARATG